MREIDQCTYEHEGFPIEYDGSTGYWTVTDPKGEFLTTIADIEEAMIYIETTASYEPEPQEPDIDDSIDHYFEELDLLPPE